VTPNASGAWALQADHLAIFIAGTWHFIAPEDGMQLFDRDAGQWLCFRSGWQAATAPASPESGSVIDVEARAALANLIDTLRLIGLFSPSMP
jgi:hypothetical protein